MNDSCCCPCLPPNLAAALTLSTSYTSLLLSATRAVMGGEATNVRRRSSIAELLFWRAMVLSSRTKPADEVGPRLVARSTRSIGALSVLEPASSRWLEIDTSEPLMAPRGSAAISRLGLDPNDL